MEKPELNPYFPNYKEWYSRYSPTKSYSNPIHITPSLCEESIGRHRRMKRYNNVKLILWSL